MGRDATGVPAVTSHPLSRLGRSLRGLFGESLDGQGRRDDDRAQEHAPRTPEVDTRWLC